MKNQNSCGAVIKQIHDELEKRVNNALRPLGLTMAQVGVLLMLWSSENGTLSLKQIEQEIHVAQSTAAGIVSRLEKKGFVQGLSDRDDRRIKMVQITQAGISCCEDADSLMRQTEQKMFDNLTNEEKETFCCLLGKVYTSLK